VPRVELDVETSLSPERVRDAQLDFTERRPRSGPVLMPARGKPIASSVRAALSRLERAEPPA
jgi:hypothetical protein